MICSFPGISDFFATLLVLLCVRDLGLLRANCGDSNSSSSLGKIPRRWHRSIGSKKWSCLIYDTMGDDMGKPPPSSCSLLRILSRPLTLAYRLTEKVEFPEDCIHILRSRPFRFAARSCNKWALGRVILCGDAAHVFPPCEYTLRVFRVY